MKKSTFLLLLISQLLTLSLGAQQPDSSKNAFSIQYEYHHLDKPYSRQWHIAGLEYNRKIGQSTLIGRFNYANRMRQHGWQVEGEAYPVFSKKAYAYASLGYSPQGPVFAKWRSGASLYVVAAKTWELEGGIRYLYFNRDIFIGTGGVSKYTGAWLFNARTFFSLQGPRDRSFFITARRYMKNEKDYTWLQLGTGISPDENRSIEWGKGALSSKRITAGLQKTIGKRNEAILSAGWSKDEYLPGFYNNHWVTTAGLRHRF